MRLFIPATIVILLVNFLLAVLAIRVGDTVLEATYLRIHPQTMPQGERLSYIWDTRTGILLPEREPIFAQALNASLPSSQSQAPSINSTYALQVDNHTVKLIDNDGRIIATQMMPFEVYHVVFTDNP